LIKHFSAILFIFSALALTAQDYPLTGHLQNLNEKEIYFGANNTLIRPAIGVENTLYDSLIFSTPESNRKSWFGRKLFDEHLIISKDSNFTVIVDPLIDFRLNNQFIRDGYLNTRGVTVNGNLGKRIFFNSAFTESQGVLPSSAKGYFIQFGTIPGYGRVKELSGFSEYDFGAAYGSIAVKASEKVNFTIGYDKLFIGDGYRSLILSDFSAPLMYFKSSAKFGKFEYNNIFTKALNPNFNNVMNLDNPTSANSRYPSKFISYNTLTYKLNQSWQISLVEALVMSSELPEWKVLLYSISPFVRTAYIDYKKQFTNNLTGVDVTWQNSKIGVVYSQIIFERFYEWYYPIASIQLGYKTFGFVGIKDLYFQLEYNRVPREMYLHPNNELHFGHYNQALAHPAGAGFNEITAIADYKIKRFEILAKSTFLKYASVNMFYNQQNIFDYSVLSPITISEFERPGYLFTDIQIIYNINLAYKLQIFAGISNRMQTNNFSDTNVFNFGLRSAIRSNYYDY
jgi:hypothetical protein